MERGCVVVVQGRVLCRGSDSSLMMGLCVKARDSGHIKSTAVAKREGEIALK